VGEGDGVEIVDAEYEALRGGFGWEHGKWRCYCLEFLNLNEKRFL
jgi:hypothetical protein